jgi:hypothetical protein
MATDAAAPAELRKMLRRVTRIDVLPFAYGNTPDFFVCMTQSGLYGGTSWNPMEGKSKFRMASFVRSMPMRAA